MEASPVEDDMKQFIGDIDFDDDFDVSDAQVCVCCKTSHLVHACFYPSSLYFD